MGQSSGVLLKEVAAFRRCPLNRGFTVQFCSSEQNVTVYLLES